MPRSIEAKHGSSLFNATLSYVKWIEIGCVEILSIGRKFQKYKIKHLAKHGELFGFSFDEIMHEVSKSELLVVKQNNMSGIGKCYLTHSKLALLLNPKITPGFAFAYVLLNTEPLDKIRAQAKELRTDNAVAKAAKKPTKPKADLKTRRDVI